MATWTPAFSRASSRLPFFYFVFSLAALNIFLYPVWPLCMISLVLVSSHVIEKYIICSADPLNEENFLCNKSSKGG